MEIGKKIKRLRLQQGLTQEELADRCELSKGFISLLERDLTSPSIATLMDILECLGTRSDRRFSARPARKRLSLRDEDMFVKEDARSCSGSIQLAGAQRAEKPAWSRSWSSLQPGGETTDPTTRTRARNSATCSRER